MKEYGILLIQWSQLSSRSSAIYQPFLATDIHETFWFSAAYRPICICEGWIYVAEGRLRLYIKENESPVWKSLFLWTLHGAAEQWSFNSSLALKCLSLNSVTVFYVFYGCENLLSTIFIEELSNRLVRFSNQFLLSKRRHSTDSTFNEYLIQVALW